MKRNWLPTQSHRVLAFGRLWRATRPGTTGQFRPPPNDASDGGPRRREDTDTEKHTGGWWGAPQAALPRGRLARGAAGLAPRARRCIGRPLQSRHSHWPAPGGVHPNERPVRFCPIAVRAREPTMSNDVAIRRATRLFSARRAATSSRLSEWTAGSRWPQLRTDRDELLRHNC
jgi:hypothetical protein